MNLTNLFVQKIIIKKIKTIKLVNKNITEILKSKIETKITDSKKEKQNKKNVLLFEFKKLYTSPPIKICVISFKLMSLVFFINHYTVYLLHYQF
jgi:hypothetical protein